MKWNLFSWIFLENYIARKRAQMKLYQFHFNPLIYYTAQNYLISQLFQIFSRIFLAQFTRAREVIYLFIIK